MIMMVKARIKIKREDGTVKREFNLNTITLQNNVNSIKQFLDLDIDSQNLTSDQKRIIKILTPYYIDKMNEMKRWIRRINLANNGN